MEAKTHVPPSTATASSNLKPIEEGQSGDSAVDSSSFEVVDTTMMTASNSNTGKPPFEFGDFGNLKGEKVSRTSSGMHHDDALFEDVTRPKSSRVANLTS